MKKSDYEMTTTDQKNLKEAMTSLNRAIKALENLHTRLFSDSFQTAKGKKSLIAMNEAISSLATVKTIEDTMEDWEESVFDEFVGRKITRKPTRPKR